MTLESETERAQREHRRVVFDNAAERYDATRSGYPEEIVSRILATAGLETGGRVLEIGCATGQLTRGLTDYGLEITAIDISPSMIAVARRTFVDSSADLRATSFEAFQSPDSAFDLIVSATAFHWVDPRIAWRKCARLLCPGGWLALLSTGEQYDDN